MPVWGKIKLTKKKGTGVFRCDCEIQNKLLPSANWRNGHPTKGEIVFEHNDPEILKSPFITELTQNAALILDKLYEQEKIHAPVEAPLNPQAEV